jgi:2'-5' RNA ligase
MTTIRSFIAVELSDEARTALADLQNRLKTIVPPHAVRWTAPASIHLTLHFLGDITPEDIARITDVLRISAGTCSAFNLSLGGLGCFPNTRRPRIIWAGVSGQIQVLTKLHQDLGEKLKVIGYSPETRPYSPHLTLGRVKDGIPQRLISQLGQALEQAQGEIEHLAELPVTEISLMRSELNPAGAVYTQIASVALPSA